MKKRRWLLLLFLPVTLLAGVFYYNREIKSFICESGCNPAIDQSLTVMVGGKVRLATREVVDLLKVYPEVGSFTLTEKGWGNLQLQLKPKKPLFSVKKRGWYYHYDWDGRFAEKSREQKFPTLEANTFDDETLKGLKILFFFAKLEPAAQALIRDRDLLISVPGMTVKFPLSDDYRLLIAKYFYIKNNMLLEVKKNLVVNNETPITMDLRYLRPIAFKNE